jgi:hypothetical protein
MSWAEDGSIWQGGDMWAKPDESSEYIVGLYRRACAHADQVIMLIRMVAETAQHAGTRTSSGN